MAFYSLNRKPIFAKNTSNPPVTDQEILEALRSENRETVANAFKMLFAAGLPVVRAYVIQHGGRNEDAEEIFQETVVAFWKKSHHADFKLSATLSSFLVAICKRLWWKHLRQNKLHTQSLEDFSDEDFPELGLSILEHIVQERKYQVMAQVLEGMAEDCKEIIIETYYRRKSMKDLAEARNSSEGYMRNKKYRCLQYLRDEVLRRWRLLDEED